MDDYTALAIAVPVRPAEATSEPLARATDLPSLVALVRARAPGATLRLFETPAAFRYAGRPVVGAAREAGRAIYLCGPELPAPTLARPPSL